MGYFLLFFAEMFFEEILSIPFMGYYLLNYVFYSSYDALSIPFMGYVQFIYSAVLPILNFQFPLWDTLHYFII